MKPWVGEIRQHIAAWENRLGVLGWWPRFVYHFTDVHNAVTIIQSGYLYSRNEAMRLGLLQVNGASPDVIDHTRPELGRYARLYFRPKTPTQFRNEGMRPRGKRELGAHCPLPVFFCFDALKVLSDDRTEFSDGNMASQRARRSAERDFFLSIPFNWVFHDSPFAADQKSTIVFHRNAEVLVPEGLSLAANLRFVACRSVAERQTLLHLLPAEARARWEPRVRLGDHGFFFRRWTYVEEVTVFGNDEVAFGFNPSTTTPGPFHVSLRYIEDGSDRERSWQGERPRLDGRFRVQIPGAVSGIVTLYLDDVLAFRGRLKFADIPF